MFVHCLYHKVLSFHFLIIDFSLKSTLLQDSTKNSVNDNLGSLIVVVVVKAVRLQFMLISFNF